MGIAPKMGVVPFLAKFPVFRVSKSIKKLSSVGEVSDGGGLEVPPAARHGPLDTFVTGRLFPPRQGQDRKIYDSLGHRRISPGLVAVGKYHGRTARHERQGLLTDAWSPRRLQPPPSQDVRWPRGGRQRPRRRTVPDRSPDGVHGCRIMRLGRTMRPASQATSEPAKQR